MAVGMGKRGPFGLSGLHTPAQLPTHALRPEARPPHTQSPSNLSINAHELSATSRRGRPCGLGWGEMPGRGLALSRCCLNVCWMDGRMGKKHASHLYQEIKR